MIRDLLANLFPMFEHSPSAHTRHQPKGCDARNAAGSYNCADCTDCTSSEQSCMKQSHSVLCTC